MAALLGLVITACGGREDRRGGEVRFPGDTTGIVRPQMVDSLSAVVRQLNAIVLADVRDISTDYDGCEGPRTVLHLANVRSLLGGAHTDTMQIRVFGGPLPGGRYLRDSKSPRYVAGGRYVLFLFNTDWRYSPVIADYAFRVEPAAGAEMLIAPNGHAVTGVDPLGVETRTRMLFLPKGVPGVGDVRVAPAAISQFVPCAIDPDGTPRCPPIPADTQRSREFFPAAPPWTPAPATREDVVNAIDVRTLVRKIDSVATTIGATPGGYFARRPRLECWNTTPAARAR
jgi:hypothetical protein